MGGLNGRVGTIFPIIMFIRFEDGGVDRTLEIDNEKFAGTEKRAGCSTSCYLGKHETCDGRETEKKRGLAEKKEWGEWSKTSTSKGGT